MLERALDLVGPHCDIEKRLRDIPASARVRGIWVHNIERELTRLGLKEKYLGYVGSSPSALAWYPLDGAVVRLAVAGALAASPRELSAGLRQLARAQAVHFADSLLGRTMLRLLSTDPVRVLQQGAAARRQTCSYGRWDYDFGTPRKCVVTHVDEYAWLDSQVIGSAEGTMEAIGVPATFDLVLSDPYNGVLTITW